MIYFNALIRFQEAGRFERQLQAILLFQQSPGQERPVEKEPEQQACQHQGQWQHYRHEFHRLLFAPNDPYHVPHEPKEAAIEQDIQDRRDWIRKILRPQFSPSTCWRTAITTIYKNRQG